MRYLRNVWLIWVVFLVAGFSLNVYWMKFWDDFPLANGWQLLPLHIACCFAVSFFAIACIIRNVSIREFGMAVSLLLLLFIPIIKKYDQPFKYVNVTDSNLYLQSARYMLQHKTLNSNDNYFVDQIVGIKTSLGKQYLFQPGYKYYVAVLLWFTHHEQTRLIQFLALCFYSICCLLFFMAVNKSAHDKSIIAFVYLFFVLLMPSAITNINEGLTEGFFLALFFCFFYFFAVKKYFPAIVMLALCVFVRQFFLIIGLPLLAIVLYEAVGRRFFYLSVFVLLILLPVYHNLYYAGIFRFTADYSWVTTRFSEVTGNWFYFSVIKPYKSTWQFYLGIGPAKDLHWLQAMLFIPAGLALSVYLFIYLYYRKVITALLWGVLTMLLVVPTISFSGIGSFPRFQMLTYSTIIILALIFIKSAGWLKSIEEYKGKRFNYK